MTTQALHGRDTPRLLPRLAQHDFATRRQDARIRVSLRRLHAFTPHPALLAAVLLLQG